jgi:hypothetical protein
MKTQSRWILSVLTAFTSFAMGCAGSATPDSAPPTDEGALHETSCDWNFDCPEGYQCSSWGHQEGHCEKKPADHSSENIECLTDAPTGQQPLLIQLTHTQRDDDTYELYVYVGDEHGDKLVRAQPAELDSAAKTFRADEWVVSGNCASTGSCPTRTFFELKLGAPAADRTSAFPADLRWTGQKDARYRNGSATCHFRTP